MTAPKHDKTPAKRVEPNNESARTNEALAQRAGVSADSDPVADSIKANDPSLSRAAYTSHESGFNETLKPDDDTPIPGKKGAGQTDTVNK